MSKSEFTIRRMSRSDVDIAVEWAAQEGWNPGLHDAECFYQTDPKGFFIGEIDQKPVGVISAVKYGTSYGFVGFYIVRTEYRGQGYGIQLWNHAMKYLGDRNSGLDGVIVQQKNYEKSGYKLAYRNIRFEGIKKGIRSKKVSPLFEVPFQEVLAYDNVCFPESRVMFLQCWINMPGITALAKVEHGRLQGFGILRPCRKGFKIGPLYADHATIAEEIFQSLIVHTKGEPYYLDVPEKNQSAVMLAEQYEMDRVFETVRMYRISSPKVNLNRIFGVTTFELG